jgi:glyoxylase-like metal-dependent hydrolase (beta-lactamase superfamily II)
MTIRYLSLGVLGIVLAGASLSAETDPLVPQAARAYPTNLLARIREAADDIPGVVPMAVHFVTVAESRRPRRVVLDVADETPYVQARTAFQIAYDGATLMVDAGMDETVHRGFSTGAPEPYFPERNAEVQRALVAASLIVVTHEHGDHVAGIVRSAQRAAIASHTLLTRAQVETLTLAPQSPAIRLTPETAADYMVVDYSLFLPIAPGVVLLKAPGHTPGHQMVYVRLRDATELLLSGDVTWALEGIVARTQRPPSTSERIREDRDALALQIDWLADSIETSDLIVVPSHDSGYLAELVRRGVINEGLVEN